MDFITQCIHGLPEAAVREGVELASAGKLLERLAFPTDAVTFDIVEHARFQDEEATVDPGAIARGFLLETVNVTVCLELNGAIAAGRLNGGQGRKLAVSTVECDQAVDGQVAESVAVGEAERLVADKLLHTFQASARLGAIAGIDQRDLPRFDVALMHFHPIILHVEGDVRHVQEVVGKVFLDDIALVAKANHELIDSIMGVQLHYMPKDRSASDLDHRLGAQVGFFRNAGAKATGKDNCFHV